MSSLTLTRPVLIVAVQLAIRMAVSLYADQEIRDLTLRTDAV